MSIYENTSPISTPDNLLNISIEALRYVKSSLCSELTGSGSIFFHDTLMRAEKLLMRKTACVALYCVGVC